MKIIELSSKGHKTFSAFYARLKDGRTIEQHYQCDIKGYDPGGINWKLGKGRPPKDPSINTREAYDNLWREWLKDHPKELTWLKMMKTDGYVFQDSFARPNCCNQAETLYRIIDEFPSDQTQLKELIIQDIVRQISQLEAELKSL